MILFGEAFALTAQNMGRTGSISTNPGGAPWASLLVIALLWAVISAVVAVVSVRRGTQGRAWGWAASFLVGLLVAAYSFWSI